MAQEITFPKLATLIYMALRKHLPEMGVTPLAEIACEAARDVMEAK